MPFRHSQTEGKGMERARVVGEGGGETEHRGARRERLAKSREKKRTSTWQAWRRGRKNFAWVGAEAETMLRANGRMRSETEDVVAREVGREVV